jgi:hypothetical protein
MEIKPIEDLQDLDLVFDGYAVRSEYDLEQLEGIICETQFNNIKTVLKKLPKKHYIQVKLQVV